MPRMFVCTIHVRQGHDDARGGDPRLIALLDRRPFRLLDDLGRGRAVHRILGWGGGEPRQKKDHCC